MKNKKNIRILAPLVLIIWGFIGYRIAKTVRGSQTPAVARSTPPGITMAAESDTSVYVLKLNYKDPFLKGRRRSIPPPASERKQQEKKVVRKKKEIKEQPVAWPAISYLGLIERPGSGSVLCLVEWNGSSHLMKKGQTVNEVKLLEVYGDSVRLEYKGKEKRNFTKG